MPIPLPKIDRPMRVTADPSLSLAEFWALSAEYPDLRMEREPNGDINIMSPTHGGAGARGSYIFGKLFEWAEADGTGWALDSNTGCELPDGSARAADAAWISKIRWMPPSVENDSPAPCPDFVVEFRSGSDRLAPLQEKMRSWISNGCQLAWLIDPRRKVVEIYRPGRDVEIQEGEPFVRGEGPVAGFVLELGRVWS